VRQVVIGTAVHAAAIVGALGWDRLVLTLAVIGSVVVLTMSDKITGEACVGILSAVVGYLVGAGHEAQQAQRRESTKEG